MDALTAAALKNLSEEALPKLLEELQVLYSKASEERQPSPELQSMLVESYELLRLLAKWSGVETPVSLTDEPDEDVISDDEAEAEMAALENENFGQDAIQEASGEITDDEAARLLAEMDSPSEPETSESGEISDDEAARLLAEMDSPSEPETSESSEISDDEAARLLAEMDSPSDSSADEEEEEDETLAMLKKIEEERASTTSSDQEDVEVSAPHETAALSENHLETEEVEEFGNSEFSNDPDMMNDFLTNADELMETLDEQVLALEADPTNKETIEEIFRAAHTLKGAAGMFGFKAIERVMHRMENFFDKVRKEQLVADSDSVDVILQAMDVQKVLLEAVREGKPSGTKTAPMITKLNQICAGQKPINSQTPAKKEAAPSDAQSSGKEVKGAESAPQKKGKKETSTIRVDLQRLDALVNLVGELVIDRTRFANIEEELRTKAPEIKMANNMTETVQLFGRHMNEIQDIIMKVRMVPIGNAFNKFSRIVRDLARQLGKEIDLFIDGETTELDKTLVEQIGDPLVHLIRNSCDHGIEMPEDRKAAGKSSRGSILLSARQEGNQIIITIKDDGKGIPPDIIRRKGIERGLISEDENLTDQDIFALIFEPGFSTASAVTNISGRGVGMDVVKKQISKLKGIIDIDSKLGHGTTITIHLPLTLAILQSLLVKSDRDIFAIPLASVVESLRIHPSEIQRVGETEVIRRRDRVLPLLYLSDAMELSRRKNDFWYDRNETLNTARAEKLANRKEERLFVVVVGSAGRRFGIVVDSLLNQQEMVIKSLGKIMSDLPCIAGGSILGNGEVVLVLDIQELDETFRTKLRQAA